REKPRVLPNHLAAHRTVRLRLIRQQSWRWRRERSGESSPQIQPSRTAFGKIGVTGQGSCQSFVLCVAYRIERTRGAARFACNADLPAEMDDLIRKENPAILREDFNHVLFDL